MQFLSVTTYITSPTHNHLVSSMLVLAMFVLEMDAFLSLHYTQSHLHKNTNLTYIQTSSVCDGNKSIVKLNPMLVLVNLHLVAQDHGL